MPWGTGYSMRTEISDLLEGAETRQKEFHARRSECTVVCRSLKTQQEF